MTRQDLSSCSILLRDISVLATMSAKQGDIRNAAVYIEGNVIQWVGRTSEIPEVYLCADRVISLSGHVMIPGLVNTHHHMFQSLTRCIAQDSALFGWLTTLYQAWRHLRGQDVYNGCRLSIAELLLSGCTTTSDHHYIFPNDVTLDDTIRAAKEMGIRFHPTRGVMSKGESKGGLPPDCVCEEEDDALRDAERLIHQYHDPAPYSMLRMGIAPCAPFNVTHDLMIQAARLARKYPKVRLHTHLAENQEDLDFMEDHYGCNNLQYIKQVGWDKDDVWFAHCVMLTDSEMKLFAQEGIGIAHCPSSNLRLASGICPVRKLTDVGVNVGLGVDGSASNDSAHIMGEARLAMLLQRHAGNTAGMTVREALDIAIKGGARNLGRDDIGEVAPGFAADLVAWKVDDKVAFCGAQHDPVAGLLLCSPGDVSLSVINGRVIILDGQFVHVNLQDIIQAHHWSSARITAFIHPQAKEHWEGLMESRVEEEGANEVAHVKDLSSGEVVMAVREVDQDEEDSEGQQPQGALGDLLPPNHTALHRTPNSFFDLHDALKPHSCLLCHHGVVDVEEAAETAETTTLTARAGPPGGSGKITSALSAALARASSQSLGPPTPQRSGAPLTTALQGLKLGPRGFPNHCARHQMAHSWCSRHGSHCALCLHDELSQSLESTGSLLSGPDSYPAANSLGRSLGSSLQTHLE